MSPSDIPLQAILIALISAVVGSVFAAGDTAITSLSSARLGALAEQSTGARQKTFERIRRDFIKLRASYVLGRIIASAVSAVMMILACLPLSPLAPYIALGTTILVTAILYEISTSIARKYADTSAPLIARTLWPLELLMFPISFPLSRIGAAIHSDELPVSSDHRVSEAEVEIMVDQVERSGIVGPEPAEMIRNVLEFADRTARDVMVPRDKVEAIELGTPLEQVLNIVAESGHSRYPVYKEQLDNVIGLLYAKDLFKVLEERSTKKITLKDIVRSPANFVAESQPLSSLLREMRARRQHLAVVVNEFGAATGIVTLEDVLEEIVGDIRDEHDEPEVHPEATPLPIQDLGDGRILADGEISLSDLNSYLGSSEIDPDGEYDSLSGMLMQHTGRIPEAGAEINKFGFLFVVRDADDKHIGKVEIVKTEDGSA